eukprot:gene7027-14296_t
MLPLQIGLYFILIPFGDFRLSSPTSNGVMVLDAKFEQVCLSVLAYHDYTVGLETLRPTERLKTLRPKSKEEIILLNVCGDLDNSSSQWFRADCRMGLIDGAYNRRSSIEIYHEKNKKMKSIRSRTGLRLIYALKFLHGYNYVTDDYSFALDHVKILLHFASKGEKHRLFLAESGVCRLLINYFKCPIDKNIVYLHNAVLLTLIALLKHDSTSYPPVTYYQNIESMLLAGILNHIVPLLTHYKKNRTILVLINKITIILCKHSSQSCLTLFQYGLLKSLLETVKEILPQLRIQQYSEILNISIENIFQLLRSEISIPFQISSQLQYGVSFLSTSLQHTSLIEVGLQLTSRALESGHIEHLSCTFISHLFVRMTYFLHMFPYNDVIVRIVFKITRQISKLSVNFNFNIGNESIQTGLCDAIVHITKDSKYKYRKNLIIRAYKILITFVHIDTNDLQKIYNFSNSLNNNNNSNQNQQQQHMLIPEFDITEELYGTNTNTNNMLSSVDKSGLLISNTTLPPLNLIFPIGNIANGKHMKTTAKTTIATTRRILSALFTSQNQAIESLTDAPLRCLLASALFGSTQTLNKQLHVRSGTAGLR